jgi:hypothetical protein
VKGDNRKIKKGKNREWGEKRKKKRRVGNFRKRM